MAESFNGLYKWELIYPQGPRRGLDDVEFATMTYIDWFKHERLHGEIATDASYTTRPSSRRPTTVTTRRSLRRSPNNRAVTKPGALHLWRVAGPARLSLKDRGLTFATSHRATAA